METWGEDNSAQDFSDQATDPDIQIPEELTSSQEDNDNSFSDSEFLSDDSFEETSSEDNDDTDYSFSEETEQDSFEENNDFSLPESSPDFFDENSSEDETDLQDSFSNDLSEEEEVLEPFSEDNENEFDSEVLESETIEKEESSSPPQFDSTENFNLSDAAEEEQEKTPLNLLEEVSDVQTIASLSEEKKETSFLPPEDYKSLKESAENMSYTDMGAIGNPPFSVILKNIKYKEDAQEILSILLQLNFISEDQKEATKKSLEQGNLLVPRISEYSAIILCHKLRKFDIHILMGLTEEIQPGKAKDSKGLVTKSNINSNKSHNFEFKPNSLSIKDILTSTTSSLTGHEIVQYLGVASERTVVDMNHFYQDSSLELALINELSSEEQKDALKNKISSHEEASDQSEAKQDSLNDIYQSLIEKLKAHALHFQGNAIIGINFQITPILIEDKEKVNSKYQINCTGSVVWVKKQ